MRFQTRDGEILKLIYENDGVIAKRHLKTIFWSHKSKRAMEQRLTKLYREEYLLWPDRDHRKIYPIPEPICWLGWRGILYIAGAGGAKLNPPRGNNENQLRELQKKLQSYGIRWVREPRWSFLRHDIATIDFRLTLQFSANQLPAIALERWLPESEFRSDMDMVDISIKRESGRSVKIKRGVCPDAYFELVDMNLLKQGKPSKARFLLEIDMGTHDNPSFGKFKALPGVAYIKSSVYKKRFGNNHGLWLVVINGGERRLRNLMKQTKDKTGEDARMFFFTSLDQLAYKNILTEPIWWQANQSTPCPLLRM